jgi:hypothetical protein
MDFAAPSESPFRPPFEDKTPFTLKLHHVKVQVQNSIQVIVPLAKGFKPTDLEVSVPRNGKTLVISYEKGFPKWWDVDVLYDSDDDKDAHVWKGAFSETYLTKPCKTKASYVIHLRNRVNLISRTGISVKKRHLFLIVELEEISK